MTYLLIISFLMLSSLRLNTTLANCWFFLNVQTVLTTENSFYATVCCSSFILYQVLNKCIRSTNALVYGRAEDEVQIFAKIKE